MSPGDTRSGLRVPHARRSIRLPGYDYAQPGAYFVTICTRNGEPLLGDVVRRRVRLTAVGEHARACWIEVPEHFPWVRLDAFVIMPDHVHGIVWITDRTTGADTDIVGVRGVGVVGARHALPLPSSMRSPPRQFVDGTSSAFGHPPPRALSAIVGSFKSAAARAINAASGRPGVAIWQRNYYEHIIRNEPALRTIRRYIQTNPMRWGTT